MGNEMGNSNVSGLQEEEKRMVEAPDKAFEEAAHTGDAKGENQIVPAPEGKDYHEKVGGSASDDPLGVGNPNINDQTSDGKELDETTVQPPAESPKVTVVSNEAGGEDSGIQPALLANDVSDHEKLIDTSSHKNLSGLSDHQNQKQTSIEGETTTEEEKTTFDAISATHNQQSLELIDPKAKQQELIEIQADPSIEDHVGSPLRSEEIPGSNLTCDTEEKAPLSDTEATHTPVGSAVSSATQDVETRRDDFLVDASQEEDMLDTNHCEEKFEITNGDWVENVMSNLTTITSISYSDSGNGSDRKMLAEMHIIQNGSSDLEEEAISLPKSQNIHEEVPKSEDKCVVLMEETKLTGVGSEEGMLDNNPTPSCDKTGTEVKTDKAEASESEVMMTKLYQENKENESILSSFFSSGRNEDCQMEETEATANGFQVHVCDNNPILAPKELSWDTEEVIGMVPEGIISTQQSFTDSSPEEEKPVEKKIIEEIKEKKEDANAMVNDTKGKEVTEHCVSHSLPSEEARSLLSLSPVSAVQFRCHKQDTTTWSETNENSNTSTADSKQENSSEDFVNKPSNFNSVDLAVETIFSAIELEDEKPQQDPSKSIEKASVTVAETRSSVDESNESCAFSSGGLEEQENVGRHSTESKPENLNIPVQILKSPSFNFDRFVDARTEDSDQTPLLYQDKRAKGSLSSQVDVSLRVPVAKTEYVQGPLQNPAISVEEKIIKLERRDSEKSRTPFLSLMKEEEEAHIMVTPPKKDGIAKVPEEPTNSATKGVASTLHKRREKRKPRSSLFTNCMCCAAAIN